MEGKENYILLMHALLCWRRPVASLVTPCLASLATPCLASLATPCRFIDDALLALLGLTTETRPTRNTIDRGCACTRATKRSPFTHPSLTLAHPGSSCSRDASV